LRNYEIEIFETHNEVRISGLVSIELVRSIISDLVKTPDFPRRQAIWILADDVSPPPFPDFAVITEEVRQVLQPDLTDKRVALVVGGGLIRALVEMFRREAVSLPLQLQIFLNRDEALSWVKGESEVAGSSA